MSELEIYGTIGVDVTAQAFLAQLPESGPVTVRINSGGGSATEAIAIYSRLREYDGEVEMVIDGLAASAATMIAMAGDVITMRSNALMMLHKPWSGTAGDADEMRRAAKILDLTEDSMVEMYASRSGQKPEAVRAMLKEETWLSAQDAVDLGFADRVIKAGDKAEPMKAAALYVAACLADQTLPTYSVPSARDQDRASARVTQPPTETDMSTETEADARDERIKELEEANAALEAEKQTLETALEANREEVDEAVETIADLEVAAELRTKIAGDHDFKSLAALKRTNEPLFDSTVAALVKAQSVGDKQKPIGVTGNGPTSSKSTVADVLAEADAQGVKYGEGLSAWLRSNHPSMAAEVNAIARTRYLAK